MWIIGDYSKYPAMHILYQKPVIYKDHPPSLGRCLTDFLPPLYANIVISPLYQRLSCFDAWMRVIDLKGPEVPTFSPLLTSPRSKVTN